MLVKPTDHIFKLVSLLSHSYVWAGLSLCGSGGRAGHPLLEGQWFDPPVFVLNCPQARFRTPRLVCACVYRMHRKALYERVCE